MTDQPAAPALAPDVLDQLRAALPGKVFRPLLPGYLACLRGYGDSTGVAQVLSPESAEQVSAILKIANAHGVPVIPHGGGTGLVSGHTYSGETPAILVSLERMTAIRLLNADENVMIVEAGAILEDIHTAAEAVGRIFPLAIAAKGSARIGGNLSTNAGGVNVLRYGNTRDLCLGLEVVLPDGRIWNGLSRLRKDNTGYDLRDLFIGAEGTLGIITAASLKLFPKPAGEGVAYMVVDSPATAIKLLSMARDHMGEAISAFELINGTGLRFMKAGLPDVRQPFDTPPDWCVLIEVGLARGLVPSEALEGLFAEAFEAGLVSDGLVAQSAGQAAEFWNVREHIPVANRTVGAICSNDISLPIDLIPDFLPRAQAAVNRIAPFRINAFGHLGDGNLHFNVFAPEGRTKAEFVHLREEIQTAVHDVLHEMGGSFSAEHGVGRLKVGDLERYGDPVKLQMMRGIKDLFDPMGIMNPGAVLPKR